MIHRCPYCGKLLSPDPNDEKKVLCYSCKKRFKNSDLARFEQAESVKYEHANARNNQNDKTQCIPTNEKTQSETKATDNNATNGGGGEAEAVHAVATPETKKHSEQSQQLIQENPDINLEDNFISDTAKYVKKHKITAVLLAFIFMCLGSAIGASHDNAPNTSSIQNTETPIVEKAPENVNSIQEPISSLTVDDMKLGAKNKPSDIQEYKDSASIIINNDKPYFTDEQTQYAKDNLGFEKYFDQDKLSRCTGAVACIGLENMPAKNVERGSIGDVKPVGWQTITYDFIDGRYLYNRCHLIAWCLTNENANQNNLITGTRYMNIEGMLPWENKTADYINSTKNHVLYRVTPIYEDDKQLLCKGVLIEAKSIEDDGKGLSFCRFAYNVQPNVTINYLDGTSETAKTDEPTDQQDNQSPETTQQSDTKQQNPAPAETQPTPQQSEPVVSAPATQSEQAQTYVLNTKTKKFHLPSCRRLPSKNRSDVMDTRSNLMAQGYQPCNICNP